MIHNIMIIKTKHVISYWNNRIRLACSNDSSSNKLHLAVIKV